LAFAKIDIAVGLHEYEDVNEALKMPGDILLNLEIVPYL
jgi:hypothetical protein